MGDFVEFELRSTMTNMVDFNFYHSNPQHISFSTGLNECAGCIKRQVLCLQLSYHMCVYLTLPCELKLQLKSACCSFSPTSPHAIVLYGFKNTKKKWVKVLITCYITNHWWVSLHKINTKSLSLSTAQLSSMPMPHCPWPLHLPSNEGCGHGLSRLKFFLGGLQW